MTPCKNGRICQECTKVITDFRPLSDKEVAEIHMFSKEPVCGIYREDQLKIEKPIATRIKKYSKIKAKAIWIGLLGLISISDIKASNNSSNHKIEQAEFDKKFKNSNSNNFLEQDSIPKKEKLIIYGKLKDENGEDLIGGTIHIKNTRVGTISDVYGYYKLDITEALDTIDQITLVYSYTGYNIYEHNFYKSDSLEINVLFSELKISDELNMISFGVFPNKNVEEKKEPEKKPIRSKIKKLFKRKNTQKSLDKK